MEHEHGGHRHSHDDSHTPIEELLALMQFMVNHNTSHNDELKALAEELHKHDLCEAYDELMEAIKDYDAGNQKLQAALEKVKK